ncbi:hypothetical protein [Phyllobacterium sp. 22552]|uniref:hypothetical protein n=1 Tax=Phyllobacterium sp. 22552 TaxID=3453941 RepID=UPI003F82F5B0
MALKVTARKSAPFYEIHAPTDKCNQITSTLHVCAYALRLGVNSGGIAEDILSDIAETIHHAIVASEEVSKFVSDFSDLQIKEYIASSKQEAA